MSLQQRQVIKHKTQKTAGPPSIFTRPASFMTLGLKSQLLPLHFTHTHRDTHTQRHTHTETHTERHTNTHTHTHTETTPNMNYVQVSRDQLVEVTECLSGPINYSCTETIVKENNLGWHKRGFSALLKRDYDEATQ